MATRIPSKTLGLPITPGVDEVVPVEISNGLSGKKIGIVSKKVNIMPGGLTKLKMYAHVTDQQQGRGDDIIASLNGGSPGYVGQVFKPVKDNLTNIVFMCDVRAVSPYDDNFDTYANDIALTAVYTGTNGTVALDTVNYISGTQSMKITVTANGNANITRAITAYDFNNVSHVQFSYRSTTTTPTISVRLSDGINTSQSPEFTIATANTWDTIVTDIASFTGTANLSAITSITIFITNATAGDIISIDNFSVESAIQFDDDFESYANDAAIAATWIPAGAGQVYLGAGNNSVKSLDINNQNSENVLTTATKTASSPVNLLSYAGIEFDIKAIGQIKGGEYFYIELSDGVNVQSVAFTVSDNNWNHYEVPLASFTLLNLASITSVTFGGYSGQGKVNYLFDNLKFVQDPGTITVGIVDFGTTLPTTGTTLPSYDPFDSGNTVEVPLLPRKTRYINNNGIKKGLKYVISPTPPTRERSNMLIPGHYYGIVFSAINVSAGLIVDFYGSSGSVVGGSFYADGYAFTADGTGLITVSDVNDSLMFMTQSDVDCYIVGFSGVINETPGFDALIFVGIEDPTNEQYVELPVPGAYPLTESTLGNKFELGQFVVHKPLGYSVEVYYKDDVGDDVNKAIFKIFYAY